MIVYDFTIAEARKKLPEGSCVQSLTSVSRVMLTV